MPQNPNQGELFNQNPHSGRLHANPALTVPHEPTEGPSVDLNERDTALIQAMDNIAEARSERGLVEASSPNAPNHRQRLVRNEMRKHGLTSQQAEAKVAARAKEAGAKAISLSREARELFVGTTGIDTQGEDIDGVDPEVLIVSYFKNFMDKIATQKDLSKLRKRHSDNLDARN